MTLHRLLISVAIGAVWMGSGELVAQQTDAVSREVSIYNGPMMPPVVITDAVSREISVFNGTSMPPVVITDAVSREITLYNGPLAPPRVLGDAVSREVSIRNRFNCMGNMTSDGLVLLGDDMPVFVDVLRGTIVDEYLRQAADMNCDGKPDGLDIDPYVDCLLGVACPPP